MNKMQHSSHGLRIALLAGVSVVALAAAAPSAGAADVNKPVLTKAPPPVAAPKDTWTWWIEGGAFHSDGGNFGQFPAFKPDWGGEGAVGFDWQPFAPMHVVGQFRYGQATKSDPLHSVFTSGPTTITTNGTQSLREDHWLIDLGIRVADLRARLNTNASFVSAGGRTPAAGVSTAQERSTFVGAGPRFAVQGDIPLGGPWSIDWGAGAAVLFGERNVQVTSTATGTVTGGLGAGTNFVATTLVHASDSPAIFNVDAQAGLSYWFSPNVKFTVSYRFDEYFRALKTITVASTTLGTGGPVFVASNIDRSFSGPMARLTWKY